MKFIFTLILTLFLSFTYGQTLSEIKTKIESEKLDTRKQVELFKKYLKENPNDSEALYLLAVNYRERGNYWDAMDTISKAIQIDSENIIYRELRVRCSLTNRSRQDEYELAINDLNYIISTGKENGKLYQTLGFVEQRLGHYIETTKRPKTEPSLLDDNDIQKPKGHTKKQKNSIQMKKRRSIANMR